MYEERFKWVTYGEKKILEADFTNADEKLFLELLKTEMNMLKAEGKKNLVLDDGTGTKFNHKMAGAAKRATEREQPYIKKNAVIGVEGTNERVVSSVNTLADVPHGMFKTKEAATKWLLKD